MKGSIYVAFISDSLFGITEQNSEEETDLKSEIVVQNVIVAGERRIKIEVIVESLLVPDAYLRGERALYKPFKVRFM